MSDCTSALVPVFDFVKGFGKIAATANFNSCYCVTVKSPDLGTSSTCHYLHHSHYNHTKCFYNKLRVAYNNAYRLVLGYVKSDSASNMFVNNQVDNFDAHNRHLIYRLRSRILNCNNSIVVCLNDCFYIRGRYMWTSWQKSLYTV